MENRLKKIEEILAEHEKRLQTLENPISPPRLGNEAVRFDDTGRPFFNVILPHASRQELQRAAILLLMQAKRNDEPEMSSKRVSSLLLQAGVDIKGIKDAYDYLRQEKPASITAKSGKRTLILTGPGEEKAIKLRNELPRK